MILGAAAPELASAQALPGGTSTTVNPIELLRTRLGESTVATSLLPMEGAIDPNEYLVGPGDFFVVVIGSLEGSAAPISISASGRLPLPEAGSVDVSGMTLAEARSTAIQALKGAFGNVPVDVTLSQPRQFYVHVSGAVPVPGRYLSLPLGRVSSALELAFADTTRAPVTNPSYRPAFRNVSVVHPDGSENRVDLMQYFSAGRTDQNPYLRDGDVVYVPGYDPDFESVQVDGSVPFPGGYDVRPQDNLRDVLHAAGLIAPPRHPVMVRVTQMGADGVSSSTTFEIGEALGSPGAESPVSAGAHISVSPVRLAGGSASIEGWVHHPGTYFIAEGTTTLSNLIELAGGLRSDAHTSAAYLERRVLPDPASGLRPEGRFSPQQDLGAFLKADTLAIIQRMRLTDLDFLSRSYLAQEFRTQNRVSIDLRSVLDGSAEPVVLRDGDRLIVPRDEKTVYVAGQVIRPGFVIHADGRTPEYYVTAAGGRGAFASNVYLMRGATGEVIGNPNAKVLSGDVVFVDRTEDLAESAEMQRLVISERSARADARIRIAQTIAQGIGTLATLVALIVTVRRQ